MVAYLCGAAQETKVFMERFYLQLPDLRNRVEKD